MIKTLAKGLLFGLCVALLSCAILSCFNSVRASTDPTYCTEGGGIEYRLLTLVVQVTRVQPSDDTYDAYGYPSKNEPVWSIMVYNPFSNYYDDIIARWDF